MLNVSPSRPRFSYAVLSGPPNNASPITSSRSALLNLRPRSYIIYFDLSHSAASLYPKWLIQQRAVSGLTIRWSTN